MKFLIGNDNVYYSNNDVNFLFHSRMMAEPHLERI